MGRSRPTRLSRRLTQLLMLTAVSNGIALAGVSVAMELTDVEVQAQMWVSASAGAAFLLAIPWLRGGEETILTRQARLLAAAGSMAVLSVIGLWRSTDQVQPAVLLLLVPALLLFITALVAVREAGRTRRAGLVSQLKSRFQGEESERRRWAQELHDQTLQDLAAIELRLAGLARSRDPEQLAAGVEDTRVLVREQIRILRHLITQMRPLALDTLGLTAALRDLARRTEDTGGVQVRCDLSGLPTDIEPAAQVSIYRIVQEALNNALRHSACHEITIDAQTRDDVVEVTVRDDGIGLQPLRQQPLVPPRAFGLLGMNERAVAIHAQLAWSTPPEGGTLVTMRVPQDSLGEPPSER